MHCALQVRSTPRGSGAAAGVPCLSFHQPRPGLPVPQVGNIHQRDMEFQDFYRANFVVCQVLSVSETDLIKVFET